MATRPWVVESDKPTYQVYKWIGGGGFGQVFKVIRNGQVAACKQVQLNNSEAAFDEYNHIRSLQGAPHIATLHEGLEFNRKTNTLSFFMDYYRGKDLDRQVQMLKGTGILSLNATFLIYLWPTSVLQVMSRPSVPAPLLNEGRKATKHQKSEIRAITPPFAQKSDIYAFGCILYRLCTLQEPYLLDGIKPRDMSEVYSLELLELVKDHLAATALHSFQVDTPHCPTCSETFPSKNQLSKYQKNTGHRRHPAGDPFYSESAEQPANENVGLRIRGAANATSEYYDHVKATNDATNSPSCIVCRKNFNKKKQFFGHIHGANHCRSARYIAKRRADVDADKEDQRLAKWIREDMMRDD